MLASGGILVAFAVAAQTSSRPAQLPPSERYERPEPVVPVIEAPPGVLDCRYRLEETIRETLGGDPHARFKITMNYALWVSEESPLEVRVIRVRAQGRREDYRADLDSARAGDLRRVLGGADTLVMPDVAEAFALLFEPLRLTVDSRMIRKVSGGEALRDQLWSMYPPKARKHPGYRGHVKSRLSDTNLGQRFLPSADDHPPLEVGTHPGGEVELIHDGLIAKGPRAFRVRSTEPKVVLEVKEAFSPRRSDPNITRPPGPSRARLAGTRNRTLEWRPGQLCFERAAERLETRVDWTGFVDGSTRTIPLDRIQLRLWTREDGS